MPDICLDGGDKVGNNRDKNSCPHRDYMLVEEDKQEITYISKKI